MSPELTADLVEVDIPRRHRQAKTSRQVRRLERHLRRVARHLDHERTRRRLTRERQLEHTTQLLILGFWRQA